VLYTASAFISFHGRLEEQTENFYQTLLDDERCATVKDTFLIFIKENRDHKVRVLRSYQEVITDALEAAFPLKNINENDYEIDTEITDDLSFIDIINKAINIEETCAKFCVEAAEGLKGLLADVPAAFLWVSNRKKRRLEKLKSL